MSQLQADPYLSLSKAFVVVRRPGSKEEEELFDVEMEEKEIVRLTKLIEPEYLGQKANSQLNEAHLKSAISESQQDLRTLKRTLEFSETVAADLVEFTDLDNNNQQDDDAGTILGNLDQHVRDLIQEIRFLEFRKDQLEEARQSVHVSNSNLNRRHHDNHFIDVHRQICQKISSQLSNWESKTLRQKFSQDKSYKAFRERIWEASGAPGIMPPLKTFLQAEDGEEEDDDESGEELEIAGGTQNYKCPLCLGYLTEPMRSTQCNHAFCKKCFEGYLEQNRSDDAACPNSGCSKRLKLSDVVLDLAIAARIRQVRRRQQMRQDDPDIFDDHVHIDDQDSKPDTLTRNKSHPSQRKRRVIIDND